MKSKLQLSNNLNIFILVGIAVFFIPFMFFHSTIDPVLIPRFLTLAILLFFLTLFILSQSKRPQFNIDFSIVQRIIFPALLCYLLFSTISLTKAINITEGIFELLKIILSIIFLYIAAIIIIGNRKGILILVKSIILSTILLSIIGIFQYYYVAFNSIPGNFIVYSTMANKNLFSSILLLSFPFVFYGVLHFLGYWRILSILLMMLITFSIAITQTRAVWVAVVISTIIVALFSIMFFRKLKISSENTSFYLNRILHVSIILIVVVLIAVLSYFKHTIKDPHIRQAFSRTNMPVSSVSERITLWTKSVQMIKDNPIFGVGLGNWKIVLPHYGLSDMRSELGRVHFQRPHNDYLWVLSEVGIFGFVCYLSIFIIIISYIIKIVLQPSNIDDKIFSIFMLFGIIGYMIISFFSFPKERIVHSIYLMFMMATVLSIYHKLFPIQKKFTNATVLSLTIPSLILLLVSIAVGYTRLNAEIHTKRALAAREASNWEDVISEIDKAYSKFYTMDPTAAPLSWYRGVANFSLDNINKAFKDFKRAYEIHPYHIHVLNNLATCYELLGNHNSAIDYYNKALVISPRFEEALINLGAVYYNRGKYEEAYKTLLRCDQNSKNLKLSTYLEIVKNKLKSKSSD